ncbi:MAG: hypothetical protein PVI28_14270 [Gammaproteobacteria bacterium]|jgi:hypothetical protein
MSELNKHLDVGCRSLKLESLSNGSYYFACDSTDKEKRNISNAGIIILDILEGSHASGRNFAGIAETSSWPQRHEGADREVQYYNLMELSQTGFRLESDPWGIKPIYTADVEAGTLIATSTSDIIQLFPQLALPIDHLALAGLINIKTVLSNRTIHQKIRRSHTGSCYEWTPAEGLRVHRSRRIMPDTSGRSYTRSLNQIADDTTSRVEDYLSKRVKGNPGTVNFGMTGGFDSRLIAASLHSLGIQAHAFTYGEPYYTEVKTARLITQLLDIPHTILPFQHDYATRYLNLYLDTTECQASLAGAQLGNLMQIDSEQKGQVLVHGFPGDALWGKHLCLWLSDDAYDSHEVMADELTNYFMRLYQVAPIPELDVSREALYEEIRENIDDSFDPYQSFLLWDLENKQRRPIGACLLLLGSQFDVITPYYQADIIKTYLALPRAMLDYRNVIRHVLAQKYPKLAEIPHSDEVQASSHLRRRRSPTSVKTQLRSLSKRLVGDALTRRIMRNPNIWSATAGLSDRRKQDMLEQIEDLGTTMEKALGVPFSSKPLDTSRLKNFQIRNLFLIGHYAKRLEGLGRGVVDRGSEGTAASGSNRELGELSALMGRLEAAPPSRGRLLP